MIASAWSITTHAFGSPRNCKESINSIHISALSMVQDTSLQAILNPEKKSVFPHCLILRKINIIPEVL